MELESARKKLSPSREAWLRDRASNLEMAAKNEIFGCAEKDGILLQVD
jgi:hypothetical protein